MGALALRPADLRVFEGVPRVQDLRLAEVLGFENPVNIRLLIRRHLPKLEQHGEVFSAVKKTSAKGGRPGTTFFLNERQAYRLCMWSDAPNADAVQEQMVEVFFAWRHGQLGPVAGTEAGALSANDAILHRLASVADRMEMLERLVAANSVRDAEGYAAELAHFPVKTRSRKPKFWSDTEVRVRAVNWHRQMNVREAIERMNTEIGRAPSKSALARFWLWMDAVCGRAVGRSVH